MTPPTWTHAVALILAILAVAAVWDAWDHRRKETPQQRAIRLANAQTHGRRWE